MIYLEGTLQVVLSIVTTVMTGFIGYLFHKLKTHEAERELSERKRLDEIMAREKAINEALRALCRDRILQGYRYYKKHSGISPADLETMTKLYNAYHALGGNGTITAVYEKICELPLKEGD